jgi:hypothetical protein
MSVFNTLIDKLKGTRAANAFVFFARTYHHRLDLAHAQQILDRLPRPLQCFWRCLMFYCYRMEITSGKKLSQKFQILAFSLKRALIVPKRILFYPDQPQPFHAMYKLLLFLGYTVTSNPKTTHQLAVVWWLAFDGNPFAPHAALQMLDVISRNENRILNYRGRDISKVLVNQTFADTFRYSLAVDPRSYHGNCVMKLNWNALHQGQIIQCPTEPCGDDVVYQRLIHNELENGLIEDIRVPIFKSTIPFVYLKHRSVENRLVDRVHTALKATIAKVNDVLSDQEQKKICRFAQAMGLDYCEVDVLRDRDDGRIYIVDANNTPSGPPSPIGDDEGKIAVARLADAFESAFNG